jgi:hypothetical protein
VETLSTSCPQQVAGRIDPPSDPQAQRGERVMAKVSVRHNRLTRGSALGMILIGVFALLFVSGLIGIILIIVGVVMYRFYRKQTRSPPASSIPSPSR